MSLLFIVLFFLQLGPEILAIKGFFKTFQFSTYALKTLPRAALCPLKGKNSPPVFRRKCRKEQNRKVKSMPKDTVAPEVQARMLQDNVFLYEAQIAFLEEIHRRGGSLIATSHAFQVSPAELARRACMLGLMSFWQATDYDTSPTSSPNLPCYIALEDCLVAMTERHGTFDEEENLLALQVGISKIKRDETWSLSSFQAFLKAGETLFASCRDEEGVTSIFASIGLDALDRTSFHILKENGGLRHKLYGSADTLIEAYFDYLSEDFDHLSEEEVETGTFDVISVARGQHKSPAWITGKLLVSGLIPLHHFSIDPVIDRETRALAMAEMNYSALTIASRYADALMSVYTQARHIDDTNRHLMRLRLAAAEAGLKQLTELNAQPSQIMPILDQLDRAAREAGTAAHKTSYYSFAGHSRLFLQSRHPK